MKNLSLSNTIDLSEQRESLIKINPDSFAGVYSIKHSDASEVRLCCHKELLACYPNDLETLDGLTQNNNITILNLLSLRKGVIEVLHGNNIKINDRIILLSGGVIDYVEDESLNNEKNLILLLRNSSGVGSLEYTSVAGRNTGEDLVEELERELYEEAPFLGKNAIGEYCLAIPKGNNKGKDHTIEGIKLFLEYFYNLNNDKIDDQYFINQFEKNFPGIKYKDLGGLLREVIIKDNFIEYSWEKGNIPEIQNNIKVLSIGDHKVKVYIYIDQENNTIGYRDIRKITGLPKGFKLLSEGPSRLYLESKNQVPIFHKLGSHISNATPTITAVNQAVRTLLK